MTDPAALTVLAPVPGRALPLQDVPDPVFARAMVGPGAAVDPPRTRVQALAPVSGRLTTVRPHAFVVQAPSGAGILVHLGIDTVQLAGAGFAVHRTEGAQVRAGDPVVSWDAAAVAAGGRSPVCPVVALDAARVVLAAAVTDRAQVGAGEPLFERPL